MEIASGETETQSISSKTTSLNDADKESIDESVMDSSLLHSPHSLPHHDDKLSSPSSPNAGRSSLINEESTEKVKDSDSDLLSGVVDRENSAQSDEINKTTLYDSVSIIDGSNLKPSDENKKVAEDLSFYDSTHPTMLLGKEEEFSSIISDSKVCDNRNANSSPEDHFVDNFAPETPDHMPSDIVISPEIVCISKKDDDVSFQDNDSLESSPSADQPVPLHDHQEMRSQINGKGHEPEDQSAIIESQNDIPSHMNTSIDKENNDTENPVTTSPHNLVHSVNPSTSVDDENDIVQTVEHDMSSTINTDTSEILCMDHLDKSHVEESAADDFPHRDISSIDTQPFSADSLIPVQEPTDIPIANVPDRGAIEPADSSDMGISHGVETAVEEIPKQEDDTFQDDKRAIAEKIARKYVQELLQHATLLVAENRDKVSSVETEIVSQAELLFQDVLSKSHEEWTKVSASSTMSKESFARQYVNDLIYHVVEKINELAKEEPDAVRIEVIHTFAKRCEKDTLRPIEDDSIMEDNLSSENILSETTPMEVHSDSEKLPNSLPETGNIVEVETSISKGEEIQEGQLNEDHFVNDGDSKDILKEENVPTHQTILDREIGLDNGGMYDAVELQRDYPLSTDSKEETKESTQEDLSFYETETKKEDEKQLTSAHDSHKEIETVLDKPIEVEEIDEKIESEIVDDQICKEVQPSMSETSVHEEVELTSSVEQAIDNENMNSVHDQGVESHVNLEEKVEIVELSKSIEVEHSELGEVAPTSEMIPFLESQIETNKEREVVEQSKKHEECVDIAHGGEDHSVISVEGDETNDPSSLPTSLETSDNITVEEDHEVESNENEGNHELEESVGPTSSPEDNNYPLEMNDLVVKPSDAQVIAAEEVEKITEPPIQPLQAATSESVLTKLDNEERVHDEDNLIVNRENGYADGQVYDELESEDTRTVNTDKKSNEVSPTNETLSYYDDDDLVDKTEHQIASEPNIEDKMSSERMMVEIEDAINEKLASSEESNLLSRSSDAHQQEENLSDKQSFQPSIEDSSGEQKSEDADKDVIPDTGDICIDLPLNHESIVPVTTTTESDVVINKTEVVKLEDVSNTVNEDTKIDTGKEIVVDNEESVSKIADSLVEANENEKRESKEEDVVIDKNDEMEVQPIESSLDADEKENNLVDELPVSTDVLRKDDEFLHKDEMNGDSNTVGIQDEDTSNEVETAAPQQIKDETLVDQISDFETAGIELKAEDSAEDSPNNDKFVSEKAEEEQDVSSVQKEEELVDKKGENVTPNTEESPVEQTEGKVGMTTADNSGISVTARDLEHSTNQEPSTDFDSGDIESIQHDKKYDLSTEEDEKVVEEVAMEAAHLPLDERREELKIEKEHVKDIESSTTHKKESEGLENEEIQSEELQDKKIEREEEEIDIHSVKSDFPISKEEASDQVEVTEVEESHVDTEKRTEPATNISTDTLDSVKTDVQDDEKVSESHEKLVENSIVEGFHEETVKDVASRNGIGDGNDTNHVDDGNICCKGNGDDDENKSDNTELTDSGEHVYKLVEEDDVTQRLLHHESEEESDFVKEEGIVRDNQGFIFDEKSNGVEADMLISDSKGELHMNSEIVSEINLTDSETKMEEFLKSELPETKEDSDTNSWPEESALNVKDANLPEPLHVDSSVTKITSEAVYENEDHKNEIQPQIELAYDSHEDVQEKIQTSEELFIESDKDAGLNEDLCIKEIGKEVYHYSETGNQDKIIEAGHDKLAEERLVDVDPGLIEMSIVGDEKEAVIHDELVKNSEEEISDNMNEVIEAVKLQNVLASKHDLDSQTDDNLMTQEMTSGEKQGNDEIADENVRDVTNTDVHEQDEHNMNEELSSETTDLSKDHVVSHIYTEFESEQHSTAPDATRDTEEDLSCYEFVPFEEKNEECTEMEPKEDSVLTNTDILSQLERNDALCVDSDVKEIELSSLLSENGVDKEDQISNEEKVNEESHLQGVKTNIEAEDLQDVKLPMSDARVFKEPKEELITVEGGIGKEETDMDPSMVSFIHETLNKMISEDEDTNDEVETRIAEIKECKLQHSKEMKHKNDDHIVPSSVNYEPLSEKVEDHEDSASNTQEEEKADVISDEQEEYDVIELQNTSLTSTALNMDHKELVENPETLPTVERSISISEIIQAVDNTANLDQQDADEATSQEKLPDNGGMDDYETWEYVGEKDMSELTDQISMGAHQDAALQNEIVQMEVPPGDLHAPGVLDKFSMSLETSTTNSEVKESIEPPLQPAEQATEQIEKQFSKDEESLVNEKEYEISDHQVPHLTDNDNLLEEDFVVVTEIKPQSTAMEEEEPSSEKVATAEIYSQQVLQPMSTSTTDHIDSESRSYTDIPAEHSFDPSEELQTEEPLDNVPETTSDEDVSQDTSVLKILQDLLIKAENYSSYWPSIEALIGDLEAANSNLQEEYAKRSDEPEEDVKIWQSIGTELLAILHKQNALEDNLKKLEQSVPYFNNAESEKGFVDDKQCLQILKSSLEKLSEMENEVSLLKLSYEDIDPLTSEWTSTNLQEELECLLDRINSLKERLTSLHDILQILKESETDMQTVCKKLLQPNLFHDLSELKYTLSKTTDGIHIVERRLDELHELQIESKIALQKRADDVTKRIDTSNEKIRHQLEELDIDGEIPAPLWRRNDLYFGVFCLFALICFYLLSTSLQPIWSTSQGAPT